MEDYLSRLTDYLLTQSWQIAVLVFVVATVSFALKNRSSHVRYLLWLVVLAKCLVPPLLTVPLAVLPVEEPATTFEPADITMPATVASTSVPELEPPVPRPTAQITGEKQAKLTTRQWLGLAWIAGMTAFVLLAITKALRTEFWLKRERKLLPDGLQREITELFRGFGIRSSPKLWLVEGVGQPFVWGLLRGGIYLPGNFIGADTAEHRRGILGHELSHVLRFDAAVNLLQIAAQGVFWFHPLVWWANKNIRAEREKCCDEMVIARLGAAVKDYSSAIVNILITEHESTRPVPSLAVAGPVKNIEERIKTMLRPGKKFYKRPGLIVASTILLAAFLTVPTALVLTARAAEKVETESRNKPAKSLHEAVELNNVAEVRRLIAGGADVHAKNARGFTPLNWGAWRGSLSREVAEMLINAGADVNAQDDAEGLTALHNAIIQSSISGVDIIHLLVEKGANINLTTKKGGTPLHWAVDGGNLEIVRLLVDKGANFNVKTDKGWTAFSDAALYGRTDITELFLGKGADTSTFHMAAFTGNLARVKELVETGIDVNAKDGFGWIALFWACCSGQTEVAEFLIENKADLAAQDVSGRALLHQAAQAPRDATRLVELLIAHGADVHAKNARGQTPLILACRSGNKSVVESLIAKGADVNARTSGGGTPLHAVAGTDHVDVAELLISRDADVDAELSFPFSRYTPLHVAATRNADMVEFLIEHGADINAASGSLGRTAFHKAVIEGKMDIVRLLIDKGADVNAADRTPGLTPLAWAVHEGHADIIALLLAKGANVNAHNSNGDTPLDLAEERGNAKIIDLLRKHGAQKGSPTLLAAVTSGDIEQVESLISEGADVNAKNEQGQTLLHLACQRGSKEIADLLIENKANIETQDDRYGDTALHFAAVSGHKDIVELLIAKGADIEAKNSDGGSPLSLIAGYGGIYARNPQGQHEIMELLIAKGANIESRSFWDCTPLYVAVLENRPEVAELLMKHGAELDTVNRFWGTVAHGAMRNQPEMVRWCINKGIDIPPLHQASYFGEIEKVKSLLGEGANVNQKDIAQFTPPAFCFAWA